MSDSEESEYEIDFVYQARVEKAKGQTGGKQWKFLVRWKGYGSDEDSWEPIENFASQDCIDAFWARTGDQRDVHKVSQFNVGEKFLPLGPPRRKGKKKKSIGHAEPSAQGTAQAPVARTPPPSSPKADSPEIVEYSGLPNLSPKRRREQGTATAPPTTTKRKRDEPSSSASVKKSARLSARTERPVSSTSKLESPRKKPRLPSPELVPDSDADVEMVLENNTRSISPERTGAPPSPPASDKQADPLFDEDHPDNKLPHHRLREKNPLVKTFEDPALATHEGQLSAKTRAIGRKQPSGSAGDVTANIGRPRPSSATQKPKASLLTASKGKLQTVKGNYKPTSPRVAEPEFGVNGGVSLQVVDSAPAQAPSGEELLTAAGLNAEDANDLPDFEETPALDGTGPVVTDDPRAQEREESLNKAKESLFPTSSFQDSGSPSGWNRSTIFDPLTAGTQSSIGHSSTNDFAQPEAPFSLTLDASVSIPVNFGDVTPPGLQLAPSTPDAHRKPGQFYASDAAGALLDSVRSMGLSGRVTVDQNASAELKHHYQLFQERLERGELFVAMAGTELFAFCSADNEHLCSRMNVFPNRIATAPILVCKVAIDNYSGYSAVIGQADQRQWSQYVASLS